MKSKIKKMIVFLLAILIIAQPIMSTDSYAATTKVTYKGAISSMGSTVGKFTVKGYDAFCAQHSKASPPTGTVVNSIKKVTNVKMRKALYYGYGGPEAKVKKNNAGWVSTSVALSLANGYSAGTASAKKFYNSLGDYATPPPSFTVYYCDTANNKQDLCYWIYNPEGMVRVKKTSTDTDALASNGYSLQNAVYGVYTKSSCTDSSRVAKLTTNKNGVSSKVTLDKGTYYIKEISAPTGFSLSTTVYTVKITDQCDKTVTVKDAPKKGKLQLIKSSAKPEVTDGNSAYSLSGAAYGVYSDSSLSNKVGTLTTTSSGKSNTLSLYADTYYIKENTAPLGYEKDSTVYKATISVDSLSTVEVVNVKDVPKDDPFALVLRKVDATTKEPIPTGDGELEGAVYVMKYYRGIVQSTDPAQSGNTPTKEWKFKTDEKGYIFLDDEYFVSGDSLYYGALNKPTLYMGTFTIQEETPPKGYNINQTLYTVPISTDGANSVITENAPITPETPIMGNIEIKKTDSDTGEPLSGVTFNIIDKSENEVVKTITTDENGYATTKEGESNKGTLLYGTYIVRETNPLFGYNKIDDMEVMVDEENETVTLEVQNAPAKIKTAATCVETNTREAFPTQDTTITDKVTYENLVIGYEYMLNGKLMDKDTGEPLLIDGEEVTASQTFTPTKSKANITLTFNLDARTLANKTVVIFEDLYLDGTKVTTHSNLNDKKQTITFLNPKIETQVIGTDTNSNLGIAKKDSEFIDTVDYADLIPGIEYTIISYLVDKETGRILGDIIEDSDGDEGQENDETIEDGEYEGGLELEGTGNTFEDVHKERTFTPTEANGAIDVTFNLNASTLTGRKLVVYEEIYTPNGEMIASHMDINDEKQTITFINPKIGTLAYVNDTKEHITFAKDSVTIIDAVDYTGLAPNIEYKLDTVVMDKETGEPLLVNGNQITKSTTFIPTEGIGVKKVDVTFDASDLKGKSIVIFEKLYFKDVELAKHEDINDEGQTIHFPSIKTTLTDADTGSHISKSNAKDELIDVVEYENLIPRHEYELNGILHDKETGELILVDGEKVTATAKFIPSKANGKEEIVFKLDTTQLEGKTVVAYETLLLDSVEIAHHKDINDENQAVSIPKISTSAKDSKTMSRIAFAEKETTLIDTAKYSGILKDEEYKFVGTLIDEESGKVVENEGKPIVVNKTFNSTDTSGEIEIEFNFDSRDYIGKKVVIYEELYHNGNLVGEHKDINDVNQTIHFPEIATNATDKITGAHVSYAGENATVIDTVGYKNLIPNVECELQGILMNADTNEPIMANGEQVTSEKVFTSEEEDGEIKLEFNLDARELQNVTAVVFETLYVDGKKIAEHKDITDENQSIHFPTIKTQLTNITTQNHIAFASDETVLLDTVSYENLTPKDKYLLTGVLVDAETGELITIDDEVATSSVEFKPDEPNGTAEVKFDFDYSKLEGKTVVAFETLSYEGNVIAEHKDITDAEQSVTFPKIRTLAIDSETKCHISYADNEVTVTDTVDFNGLNVGDEYTVKGIAMNKYAESPIIINDATVTSELTFVPETTDGQVELTFKFDAETLAGDTIVIFEEVYFDGHVIAEHKDFNDENQTIHFPRIKTYAKDKETGSQTITYTKGKVNTIVDTIEYDNLPVDNEYLGKGILMEQQTGEPIQNNGELVEGEVKFTPNESNGTVEVEFSIDASDYKNSAVVVFEELYLDGNIIASHKDINDKSQTIKFYDEPKTGNSNFLILLAIMFGAIMGIATVFIRRTND